MILDEGVDVSFQLCSGAVYAALQLLSYQLCEPALDLIDPGCRRWREVNMPVGPACEPCFDPRGLVGRVIVHHPMRLRPIRHFSVDPLQEVEEFGCPVTLVAMAGSAIPGAMGSTGLAIQCLDLRFLIHAKDDRPVRDI